MKRMLLMSMLGNAEGVDEMLAMVEQRILLRSSARCCPQIGISPIR
jgi:hypothetical protein